MILLILFAFLAGVVTILSPCILPILPIILTSTIGGQDTGKSRPLGVVIGFILSFTFFTLFLSTIVRLSGIPADTLRLISVVVIAGFGASLLIPQFQVLVERLFSKLAGFMPNSQRRSGFGGGLLIGLSVGLLWTPCVGPILASVISLAITGAVTFDAFLIILAYSLGTAIPLFLIMLGGQNALRRVPWLLANTARIQKAFGVFMIITAIAIFTNVDRKFQLFIIDRIPGYGVGLNKFQDIAPIKKQLDNLKGGKQTSNTPKEDMSGLFNVNTPAPEFVGITKWLNTDHPLTIKELKGKVVLVDFWTYTCINCIRTLPHVTGWYDKYKDQGFVVIGVHTPEFEFEKKSENVLNAIKQYKINYPVPQDNDYATWNAYNNQYWPAEYLIDAKGNIRRTHFGEGKYDETEKAIQALLKEAGQQVSSSLENMPDQTPKHKNSPETYVGSKRMQYYYPGGSVSNGQQSFTLSPNIPKNSFSFGGEWNITDEQAIAGKNAILSYNFTANKVFLVLRPGGNNNGRIQVSIDGKVVDSSNAGEDVKDGIVTIDTDRLYTLIDLHGKVENHILKLEFQTSGVEAFAFTFG